MKSVLIPLLLAIAAFFLGQELAKAEDYKHLIYIEAKKQGVDPLLAISIAQVESSMNPKAVGPVGELGLFQLRPEYHGENVADINHNIAEGIRYLKELQSTCPLQGDYFVICFNQGHRRHPKHPEKHPYYRKVIREREKMEFAHLSY